MDLPTLFTSSRVHTAPMTEAVTRNFLECLLAESSGAPIAQPQSTQQLLARADTPPTHEALKAITGRLAVVAKDLEFSELVVLFITTQCRTFSDCTLWVYSLVKQTRAQGRCITISDLAELLPWGMPTAAFKEEIWDKQKGSFDTPQLIAPFMPQDNWLDTKEAYAA